MSEPHEERSLPVSFSSLIISLAGSAMMHLGETPNPATGEITVDLGLARNTIDVIAMLRDKTEGNRDEEESKLINTMLYEIQTRYVNVRSSK